MVNIITYSFVLSFSNGFGLNLVASEQVPVYISEITPKNLRGGFATVNQVLCLVKGEFIAECLELYLNKTASLFMQFMICCGASLAYVLGTFITWRTLAIIGKEVSWVHHSTIPQIKRE